MQRGGGGRIGRVALTARGVAAGVVAALAIPAGVLLGVTPLTAFGVLLVVALVVAVVVAALPGGPIDVARTVTPALASVGDRVEVAIRVRRRAGIRMLRAYDDTGLAALGIPQEDAGDGVLRYRFEAARRGTVGAGPVEVRTTDPFGLVVRRDVVGVATAIRIGPAAVELAPWRAAQRDADGPQPDRPVPGLDDVTARPHAPGDPLRRIHWRASARRGELMVRQEESGAAPEAVVVLDRTGWSPLAGLVGLDAAFERAVVATAAATRRLADDGFAVTVADTRGAVLVRTAATTHDPREAAVALADVAADDGDRATSAAGLTALLHGDDLGAIVLVSPDGAGFEGLAAGAAPAVLVHCGPDAGRLPLHGVVAAPPGTDLADAWLQGVRG